ncbi:Hypothetical predicted protein [Podarcis lilfordi]|uniref:Uncharacterized protein n=1 Tax=Podarcis lilfordi TaxID=74358 RepID=A0AA35K2Y2_9SAUR|nr:Hypothetical predicted protein [Podarcis lilfordi]
MDAGTIAVQEYPEVSIERRREICQETVDQRKVMAFLTIGVLPSDTSFGEHLEASGELRHSLSWM